MSDGPIMIMAGGTGGLVFPGLAVAEEIRSRSGSVVWMGTRKGLEARLVPDAGIEVEWISVSGVRSWRVCWVACSVPLGTGNFPGIHHATPPPSGRSPRVRGVRFRAGRHCRMVERETFTSA